MGGCRTAMESRNPVKEKKKVHQQNFRPSTSHTPKQGIFHTTVTSPAASLLLQYLWRYTSAYIHEPKLCQNITDVQRIQREFIIVFSATDAAHV